MIQEKYEPTYSYYRFFFDFTFGDIVVIEDVLDFLKKIKYMMSQHCRSGDQQLPCCNKNLIGQNLTKKPKLLRDKDVRDFYNLDPPRSFIWVDSLNDGFCMMWLLMDPP